MGKSDPISDLTSNENSFGQDKRIKNVSKRKAPLKPVDVPNLLIKNPKIYETNSNLIVTNSKKYPNLNSNGFLANASSNSSNIKEKGNENENKNHKNNINLNNNHVKNITPTLIGYDNNDNNNNKSRHNKIFLSSKNSLNSISAKNSIAIDKKESSGNTQNTYNETSNSELHLLNNSDIQSSKSSWKFDKNLLDDSSFRKSNIKKEKLEIDCDKEPIAGIHKNTFSTQTFDNINIKYNNRKIELNGKHIRESLIDDKFIANSSANRKNDFAFALSDKNKNNSSKIQDNFTLSAANNSNNIDENNNHYSIPQNKETDTKRSYNRIEEVEKEKDKEKEINQSQNKHEEQRNNDDLYNNLIMSNNAYGSSNQKIIAGLDKNGFVNKNIVNMKNLDLNKNILQNNNAIISQNSQISSTDTNINNNTNRHINNNPSSNSKSIINNNYNNNNDKKTSSNQNNKTVKKPENKLNKSLSSFKFEFDQEDPMNASTYSTLKKSENEEVFNKIMSHHILMEFHEVYDFLESLGLEKHLDNLLKNGFDDLEKMINGIFFFLIIDLIIISSIFLRLRTIHKVNK